MKKKPIIVVWTSSKDAFECACSAAVADGYSLWDMNFVEKEDDRFASWHALFILPSVSLAKQADINAKL